QTCALPIWRVPPASQRTIGRLGDAHAAAGQAPQAPLPHPSAPVAGPVVSQSNSVRGTHLGLRPPAMNSDWNNVVVIDSRTLETLGQDCRKLRRSTRLLKGT